MSHAKKEQRFWDKSWTPRQPTLTGLVTGTNSCTAGTRKFKGTRINAIEPLQALRLHKFMSPKQWWLSVSGSDLVLDTLFFLYMTPVCRDMLLCPETAQSAWNTSQLLSLLKERGNADIYLWKRTEYKDEILWNKTVLRITMTTRSGKYKSTYCGNKGRKRK